MYRFFTDSNQIDIENKTVFITGSDFNHIKNVLRMKEGDEVSVMIPGCESEYRCEIASFAEEEVKLTIRFIKESNVELPCEVILYQALPKSDKMELIITKSVELGVASIVPVATKRAVVKLDSERSGKKIARWNAISEAAAKQSKRAIIPDVADVMSMEEALSDCSDCEVKIIPYELSDPDLMNRTRSIIGKIAPGEKVAVFIGPEGGFTEEEIKLATDAGCEPITLGHRILRTETAGIVVLSWIMYNAES